MKYILLLMTLCFGQDTLRFEENSSIIWILEEDVERFEISTITPTYTLQINSPTGKALYLDFGADTLLVYGDLELDSAAVLFVNWIQWALWEYECGKLTDKKETQ